MNSRILGFVIAFLVVVIGSFGISAYLVDNEPPLGKKPLQLDYDVNLPDTQKPEIKESVQKQGYPVPDLDRPIVIYAQISKETEEWARKKIAEITDQLRRETVLIDSWIELGTYRKLIGDYEGALDIWKYAASIDRENHVVYNNIASLYSGYFGDYQKAEEYYLKAIEASPDLPYPYFAAFEFYKSVLKDDVKAEAIVKQGIKNIPQVKAELEALLDN